MAWGPENLAKIGTKQRFGRAQKINLVDLKKKRVDKILDPHLGETTGVPFGSAGIKSLNGGIERMNVM